MRLLNWILTLFFLFSGALGFAQKVPTYMDFADMKLKITESAKRQIQKDVDMLTRSPKYFGIKVKKANLYFPVIERIFKEEGLPDDFKYLVLQESALIPDAVSSSNAVGFWQFKKAAAREVNLRVDGVVDERMNIVSASSGAARYLKKYNKLFFNNWLYSLQAYNVGPGGALRSLDKKHYGAKRMVIDKKTHWYVKKYLSHKIAFESAVNTRSSTRKLAELTNKDFQNLKEINKKYGVDMEVLQNYNKWLKGRKIPDDKTYTVVVPVDHSSNKRLLALTKGETGPVKIIKKSEGYSPVLVAKSVDYKAGMEYPKIRKKVIKKTGLSYTLINGIPGMVAREQSSISSLAERGGISAKKFRAYNDLSAFDKIIPGQVYYFKRKRNKSKIRYYGAKRHESLWAISQKFGIRLDKLMEKNGMLRENDLKAGMVLWLRSSRPSEQPVEYIELPDERRLKEEPVLAKDKKPNSRQNRTLYTQNEQKIHNKTTAITTETLPTDSGIKKQENTQMTIGTDQKSGDTNPEEIWEDPEENARWINKDTTPAEKKNQVANQTPEVNVIDRKNPSPEDEFDIEESPKFINTSPPSFTMENGRKIHVIKQGETLFSIARTYDITVQDLKNWNNLQDLGNIKFDQKLIVGKVEKIDEHVQNNRSQSESDSIILHEVEEGDTIFSISRIYNVPIQKIMELNEKTDYKIAIGEKLKLVKTR